MDFATRDRTVDGYVVLAPALPGYRNSSPTPKGFGNEILDRAGQCKVSAFDVVSSDCELRRIGVRHVSSKVRYGSEALLVARYSGCPVPDTADPSPGWLGAVLVAAHVWLIVVSCLLRRLVPEWIQAFLGSQAGVFRDGPDVIH